MCEFLFLFFNTIIKSVILYGAKIKHEEIDMTYGHNFYNFKYFLAYWLFVCDFTLGMAIWFQVSRVYSWEQLWVWLDWRWLWGWSVNRYLQPIFQKTWLTDRFTFRSYRIWIQINLQEIRNACSKTGISSTKYIWLRHFAGGFFSHSLFFFQKYLLCHPKHLSSVVDEYHFINESFAQIR